MLVPMKMPMNVPAPTEDSDRATGKNLLVDGLLAIAIAVTTVAPFLFYEDMVLV